MAERKTFGPRREEEAIAPIFSAPAPVY